MMAQVCDGDLSDELGHVRSLRYSDAMSLYVAAVVDRVRSILRLRVPLPSRLTFHRAPIWTSFQKMALIQSASGCDWLVDWSVMPLCLLCAFALWCLVWFTCFLASMALPLLVSCTSFLHLHSAS